MILLQGHSLTPRDWFTPETMPMTLVETGISTASLNLGPEAPEIKLDDWVLDDAEPGAGIVWHVKSVESSWDRQTRTAQLEHVVATLKDALLFGEVTTRMLAGKSAASVEAETAARYVLARQEIWTLGDFEYSRSLPYSFNNQTVYAALETICSTLADWHWEYDLSALPFKLHIRRKREEVGCELRSDRNLLTLKRTVDRSNMYTRFYPVGARNMRISGDYVSKNEGLYGVVSRTETDQSIAKEPLLRAWAEDRLSRHCEPLVTVSISALELSVATGEPLDRIQLGLNCRVPLPEYGATILERVTRLAWSDKLREPEKVNVTLANQQNDVANIIKQLSSSGSRNSGGGAKAAEEDHAWIVDATDHVALVAEAIVGRDGETLDWSRVSEIIVDGEGIHQRVTKTEGELVTAQTSIEMNERTIQLEAKRATDAENLLTGRITVAADRITQEVADRRNGEDALSARITVEAGRISQEIIDRTSAVNTLSSRITQTATEISAEVTRAKAAENTLSGRIAVTSDKVALVVEEKDGANVVNTASIVAGINDQSGSYAKIKAKTINLDGYVTASELNATKATIDDLTSGKTTASKLVAGTISVSTLTFSSHTLRYFDVTDTSGYTRHVVGYA